MITEDIIPQDLKSLKDNIWQDIQTGMYYFSDESYDLNGPYYSEHECRVDSVCYHFLL